jgi:hypothetical protein
VVLTRIRLVPTRKVKFLYAECDFTCRVCFLHTHKSKFDTYACEYDTHECDFYTLECDSYTQSVISARSMVLTGKNVIPTRTSVISTRIRLIIIRRLRFLHAQSDLTRRVWFPLIREFCHVNV